MCGGYYSNFCETRASSSLVVTPAHITDNCNDQRGQQARLVRYMVGEVSKLDYFARRREGPVR